MINYGTPEQELAALLNTPPPVPTKPDTWLPSPLLEEQKAAAHAEPGPLIILGGAGTGKTHALLARTVHLARIGFDPTTIAIIASSARSARRMCERLAVVIGAEPDAVGFYVGTMHDFCSRMFRRGFAQKEPVVPSHFSIWTQTQSMAALAMIVREASPERAPRPDPAGLSQILEWLSVNAHLAPANRLPAPYAEWDSYAEAYENEKRYQNSLDRTDLLIATRDALLDYPDFRAACTMALTRHLIVDEFEDVTQLQYEIIRLLTGPEQSLCVAFDPNVSISPPSTAIPGLFEWFEADHPGTDTCYLKINFRASAPVTRTWRTFATHRDAGGLLDDGQVPLSESGREPRAIEVEDSPHDQYRRIANDIHEIVAAGNYAPADIAILARRRSSLVRIIPHLDALDIPFTTFGNFVGATDPYSRVVIALLTLVANPKDAWAFGQVVNFTANGLHRTAIPKIVGAIQQVARRLDTGLINAAGQICADLVPGSTIHAQIAYAIDLYDELGRLMVEPSSSVAAILALAHRRLSQADADLGSTGFSGKIECMMRLAQDCDTFARVMAPENDDDGESPMTIDRRSVLLGFLDNAAASIDSGSMTEESSRGPLGVSLASMHAAKGMQWPVVVIADAADHIVPDRDAHNAPAMMELEQRLFYVAVTRAADWYTLYWARKRDDGTSAAPSRFIKMLLQ